MSHIMLIPKRFIVLLCIEYKNIEDIVQAMNTGEVDGMMLDHYTASYYQQRDKLKSFVTVTNFELRRDVGLLFSADSRLIAECFLDYRSNIWRLAQTITGKFKVLKSLQRD